jgi:4-oxalmesaconate hydratase
MKTAPDSLIIDCHGHYTTAPEALGEYREAQTTALKTDPLEVGEKGLVDISDQQICDSLEGAQLKL